MKKIIPILAFVCFIAACGGSGNENKTDEKKDATASEAAKEPEKPATAAPSDNPDYQKGLELIAKSDCLTCHKVEEKNIGPAYRDVANKYEATPANISMLAEKVIKGGQGVWGSVPMTPHPAITKEDAEQMVKYVMLLKTK
jgi:cytochrome c